MKIGMILDTDFPPDPRVENEAVTLISAGHEVHLFCFSFSKRFEKEEYINGIYVHRFYCSKLTYKLSALAYTFPFYHLLLSKPIKRFLQKTGVDIIHIHDLQVARTVFRIRSGKKVVLDLHENRPEIMKHYAHVNSFLGKLLIYPKQWKKFEYKYIQQADKVIVVTAPAKRYYIEEIRVDDNKFAVVPNTIRTAFYENCSYNKDIITRYENSFNLLYLGETGLRRGTKELIQAIHMVKDKIPNVKLIIVGKSKEDQILKDEIEKLQLSQFVVLTGWQKFETFQSYLKVSKIGFSPLHRNIHHDTTFANKIFQYMSFGLPVVVSDSTAQKEVIEELNCGLVHKSQNVEQLAKCIIRLHEDKALYTKLSGNAVRGIKEKYNWETTSKELLQLYSTFS
jgi:glycosyltransferase involved in cell wall biosynthesis